MHPNQAMIKEFYEAFARGDSQAMARCYHSDAVFNDPVFQNLRGSQIGDMWAMLCHQAKTLEIQVKDIVADETSGRAVWSARYEFGKEARPVFNKIRAHFEFREGRIIGHEDHFNFWRWSRMALGPLGLLLGWHSGVRRKVSDQAMRNLTKFTSSRIRT